MANAKKRSVLTFVFATLVLGGCSSSDYTVKKMTDAYPRKSETKMDQALGCMRDMLQKEPEKNPAYVFMVREITDGTVKKQGYSEGPMADAGRVQMISTLSANTKPSYAVITDRLPMMFSALGNENVSLNRFGLPERNNMAAFLLQLLNYVNANRTQADLPKLNTVMPLIIDGAFTRLDEGTTGSTGYGHNGGYRGSDGEERSAAVDFGSSRSERAMTLVVNIIDPRFNAVVGTESFDLSFYNNSKNARFRVAINDLYYGFSNTDVVAESIHAAQQTLLDAAVVWILDNAYSPYTNFDACLEAPEEIALGTDSQRERRLRTVQTSQRPTKKGIPTVIGENVSQQPARPSRRKLRLDTTARATPMQREIFAVGNPEEG